MKMTDQNMASAIAAAQAALSSRELSKLCVHGGKLALDLEIGQAKLWPGLQMKLHPNPSVVLDPGSPDDPIASIEMWLPPFPGAEMMTSQSLSAKGWETLLKWVRSKFALSIPLWIARLREIETATLHMLCSQVAEEEPDANSAISAPSAAH